MTGDDDAAFPCGSIDGHVLCSYALGFCGLAELRCKVVFSYTAYVDR